MNSQLFTMILVSLVAWGSMWVDYGLTLAMARPAKAAGLVYELNPLLRADVARGRWSSPRFVLGTSVMLGALLAIGWLAVDERSFFVYNAVVAGVIVTRLHLIALHLRSGWRQAQPKAKTIPTARQAMVTVATQQTLLAAVFTLAAVSNLLPSLQAFWVGAAVGFVLMATTTLLWRWREPHALPQLRTPTPYPGTKPTS